MGMKDSSTTRKASSPDRVRRAPRAAETVSAQPWREELAEAHARLELAERETAYHLARARGYIALAMFSILSILATVATVLLIVHSLSGPALGLTAAAGLGAGRRALKSTS